MIDYIKGEATETTPSYVVLEAAGVGYEVNVTLIDYPNIKPGEVAKLYIHEAIREDAHILYGFLEKECRQLFQLLIGVSGVGPNTARLILSAMTRTQLEDAISSGDSNVLKSVKGIGGKTAQRIIVDLKDKIIKSGVETLSNSMPKAGEAFDDALSALVMLGFNQLQSQKALKKLFSTNPAMTTEQAIKQALTML